jgi:hypothetical protein
MLDQSKVRDIPKEPRPQLWTDERKRMVGRAIFEEYVRADGDDYTEAELDESANRLACQIDFYALDGYALAKIVERAGNCEVDAMTVENLDGGGNGARKAREHHKLAVAEWSKSQPPLARNVGDRVAIVYRWNVEPGKIVTVYPEDRRYTVKRDACTSASTIGQVVNAEEVMDL